jgi:hypothetical protein
MRNIGHFLMLVIFNCLLSGCRFGKVIYFRIQLERISHYDSWRLIEDIFSGTAEKIAFDIKIQLKLLLYNGVQGKCIRPFTNETIATLVKEPITDPKIAAWLISPDENKEDTLWQIYKKFNGKRIADLRTPIGPIGGGEVGSALSAFLSGETESLLWSVLVEGEMGPVLTHQHVTQWGNSSQWGWGAFPVHYVSPYDIFQKKFIYL